MFKHRQQRTALNKAWRIGYLQLKRKYGEERVQDAAAELWKLTSEERQRIEDEGARTLCKEFADDFARKILGWSEHFTREQLSYIESVLFEVRQATIDDNDPEELMQFLDDLTPLRLRIRKLTPRECFRLMDVDEKYIDMIQATGLSRSSQYKLAGNSIVVANLFHILEPLFYPEQTKQLTLF